MTKKNKDTEREQPEIYIGNETVVPRSVPLQLNEENWKKLEEEIDRIRELDEKTDDK